MKWFLPIFFISITSAQGAVGLADPCTQNLDFKEKFFIPSQLQGDKKNNAKIEETNSMVALLEAFVTSHPDWKFTEIEVISSSANTPIAKIKSLKNPAEVKKINKENKMMNRDLAEVRLNFSRSRIRDIMGKFFPLASVKTAFHHKVLGGEFNYSLDPRENDSNLKYVVPEFSSDYESRVNKIFEENKADYQFIGIESADQLKDKEHFKSLYEVKFKSFQGITVFIKGQKKTGVKCTGKGIDTTESGNTTKQ